MKVIGSQAVDAIAGCQLSPKAVESNKSMNDSLAAGTEAGYVDEITTEQDAMSKTVDQVINELAAEITAMETDVRKKKETVNTLCEAVKRPPAYVLDKV